MVSLMHRHSQPATRECWRVSRLSGPFALPQECDVSLPLTQVLGSSMSSECGGRDPRLYSTGHTAQGHLLGFPVTLERIFWVLFGVSKFSFHVFKINFF